MELTERERELLNFVESFFTEGFIDTERSIEITALFNKVRGDND